MVHRHILVQPCDICYHVALAVGVALVYLHQILVVVLRSVAVHHRADELAVDVVRHRDVVFTRWYVHNLDLLHRLVVVDILHESHLVFSAVDGVKLEPCFVHAVADILDLVSLVVESHKLISVVVHLCRHVAVCQDISQVVGVVEQVFRYAHVGEVSYLHHSEIGVRSRLDRDVEIVYDVVVLVESLDDIAVVLCRHEEFCVFALLSGVVYLGVVGQHIIWFAVNVVNRYRHLVVAVVCVFQVLLECVLHFRVLAPRCRFVDVDICHVDH